MKSKKEVLIQLKSTPIVQVACQKAGVGRATYYRWRADDPNFKKDSDDAIKEGVAMVNDMAESQLISLIRDKHPTSVYYWLNNHHPAYAYKRLMIPEEESKKIMSDITSSRKYDASLSIIQKMVDGEIPIPLVKSLIPVIERIRKDVNSHQGDDLINILSRIIDGNSYGRSMSEEDQEKLRLDFHEVCGTVDTDESSNSTT